MDFARIFHHLGTLGAGDASTYERAVETWLDPAKPIPTLAQCQAAQAEIDADPSQTQRETRRAQLRAIIVKARSGQTLTAAEMQAAMRVLLHLASKQIEYNPDL